MELFAFPESTVRTTGRAGLRMRRRLGAYLARSTLRSSQTGSGVSRTRPSLPKTR